MSEEENNKKEDSVEQVLETASEAAAAAEENESVPEETVEERLAREAAEWQNKYLYLQAEYQNYRKRIVKDLADARNFAVSDTLTPFLTVFDYLTMAGNAAETSDNIESIRQGLKMIMGEFFKAFDELGVKKLDSVGKAFDPNLHDAVAKEPSDTVPEGDIIREWSSGFMQHERLLRAARVVVSAGKEEPAETPEAEKAE